MKELIQITRNTINGAEVNSVNARNIHTYLKVNTLFPTWIKRAIEKYDFVENEDYVSFVTDSKSGKRDFIVSMDMAKELCMLENNPIGKETRKYFIKIEKESSAPMTQIEIVAQTAIALVEQEKKLLTIQSDVDEVKTYIDEDIKTRPVSYQQQKALQDAKMTKVYALGGSDEALVKKLHSRVWSIFKKRFALPRYAALPASKFEEGLEFIRDLTIADMV